MVIDFYTLDEDKQESIMDDIFDAVSVSIDQCDTEDIPERFNYYLNNEDYELSVVFFDEYPHELFDDYINVEDISETSIVVGQMSFAPAGQDEPLEHDLIHVANIVYDMLNCDDNVSTVILTL